MGWFLIVGEQFSITEKRGALCCPTGKDKTLICFDPLEMCAVTSIQV